VAQTLTLLSLSSVAVGLQESTVATVQSVASTAQLSVTLGALDLVNSSSGFTVELWRLDDDSVWRLDHGFTFQGLATFTSQPSMQCTIGNLAGRQIKARFTNNGILLASAIVTLTVN
jgi:hypothetical protein